MRLFSSLPCFKSSNVFTDLAGMFIGNIARHTIPKSQGKQHYYDARKSKWGDSFPWESKNGPDVRRRGRPLDSSAPTEGNSAAAEEPSDNTPLDELEGEWEMSFGADGKPKLTRTN